jgi:hypothetical protein
LVLGILLAPGASRVVRNYVLPNVAAAILVVATTQLGAAVLAESTLSFLGYGVPPPFPTWGSMLSGTGANSCFSRCGCRSGPGWPSAPPCSASTCSAMRYATYWIRACVAADYFSGRMLWI